MRSLRAFARDLLQAAALIAFTVAADALTRPPEPQLGLPGEDLIVGSDELLDVARAVGIVPDQPTPLFEAVRRDMRHRVISGLVEESADERLNLYGAADFDEWTRETRWVQ